MTAENTEHAGAPGKGGQGVFRVSRGYRIFLSVLGLLGAAMGGGMGWFALTDESLSRGVRIFFFSFAVVFFLAMACLVLQAFRASLRFEGKTLEITGIISRRVLEPGRYAGYRVIRAGYFPSLIFVPPGGAKKSVPGTEKQVSVDFIFERRKELFDTLNGFLPFLDGLEVSEEIRTIARDESLGTNEEDRLREFNKLRKLVKAGNALAMIICLAGFLWPRPYRLIIVLLAMLPAASLLTVYFSRGRIKLDQKRNGLRPDVMVPFMLPPLVLALRAMLDFSIFSWRTVILPSAVLAGALGLLFALVVRREKHGKFTVFALLGFILIYGYGAAVTLNGISRQETLMSYSPVILEKRLSEGSRTNRYFSLSAWADRPEGKEVPVGRRVFEAYQEGDAVEVVIRRGWLRITRFVIR